MIFSVITNAGNPAVQEGVKDMSKQFFKAVVLSFALIFATVGHVDAARLVKVLAELPVRLYKNKQPQHKNLSNKPSLQPQLQRLKLLHHKHLLQVDLGVWVEFLAV